MSTRKQRIADTLQEKLHPTHLEVIDDSASHAEHLPVLQGHVNSEESHFHIVIVSPEFEGKMLIKRHRAVNDLVGPEFDTGLHALTIKAFTPEEWASQQ